MSPDPEHTLTITRRPIDHGHITIGRCSCRLFSMLGPADTIRDFHEMHLQYPTTSLKGTASK